MADRSDPKFVSALAVIGRADWGALSPRTAYSSHTPRLITLHHCGGSLTRNFGSASSIKNIQNLHMARTYTKSDGTRGLWKDIGYHYVVGPDGTIWRGRPEWAVGGHVGGANTGNIGISMYGNFNLEDVPQTTLDTVISLIADIRQRHDIAANKVKMHNEFESAKRQSPPKNCPGKYAIWHFPQIVSASTEVMSMQADRGMLPDTDPSRYDYEPLPEDSPLLPAAELPDRLTSVQREQPAASQEPSGASFAVIGVFIAAVIFIVSQLLGD